MASPLVRASSNGATTGPAAGQAQFRSSSSRAGTAGAALATPVRGTAVPEAAEVAVGVAALAPLAAFASGLDGMGGSGLNVAAGADEASVVVVVVVVTVEPGGTSPAGGAVRSTCPTSR